MKANIKTNKGTIELDLFYDKAQITVSNFVNLSNKGYYNNLSFHRVLENFMIQGGCPLGTGTGGPGYQFEDEFHPELKHDKLGILSMANAALTMFKASCLLLPSVFSIYGFFKDLKNSLRSTSLSKFIPE